MPVEGLVLAAPVDLPRLLEPWEGATPDAVAVDRVTLKRLAEDHVAAHPRQH